MEGDLSSRTAEVSALKEECARLQSELVGKSDSGADLAEESDRLRREVAELKRTAADRQARHREEADEWQRRLCDVQEELFATMKEHVTLGQQVKSLLERCNVAEENSRDMSRRFTMAESLAVKRAEEIATLKQRAERAEEKVRERDEQLDKLTKTLKETQTQLAALAAAPPPPPPSGVVIVAADSSLAPDFKPPPPSMPPPPSVLSPQVLTSQLRKE
eukprot:Opistho-2@71306